MGASTFSSDQKCTSEVNLPIFPFYCGPVYMVTRSEIMTAGFLLDETKLEGVL